MMGTSLVTRIIGPLMVVVTPLTVSQAQAQVPAQQPASPKAVIEKLFDGMRQGNGDLIRPLIIDGASLDRVGRDGQIVQGDFDRWISWVDQQNEGDADEQIFEVRVQEFGGIATVWAPFVLRYKGKIAGCGLNQFTLVKKNDEWRILHGIDTAHTGDCTAFRETYTGSRVD